MRIQFLCGESNCRAKSLKLESSEGQQYFYLQLAVGTGSFAPGQDGWRSNRGRNLFYYHHGRKVRLQMNTHAVSQVLPTKEMLVSAVVHPKSPASLEKMGIYVSRYGLVVTLLLIGVLKFSAAEAHGIQPLLANSPLMSWLYRVFSLQGVSNLIATIEIIVASLIALRPFRRKSHSSAAWTPSSLSCSL